MFKLLWSRLPGPVAAKALALLILLSGLAALCWYLVYPSLAEIVMPEGV